MIYKDKFRLYENSYNALGWNRNGSVVSSCNTSGLRFVSLPHCQVQCLSVEDNREQRKPFCP